MATCYREFYQLDSPLQKRYEGTGLGLVLSKTLIEMLGGSIQCKKQSGNRQCVLDYNSTETFDVQEKPY